jgi:hypothetical protein
MKKRNLFRLAVAFLGILLTSLYSNAAAALPSLKESPPLARVFAFDPGFLPFSFQQVLRCLDDAFQKPGYKIQDNIYVFIQGSGTDEPIVMTVSAMGPKIAVTVTTTGDWGVNYIREFFEAPFFFQSETEQLYALLNAGAGARSATLGRFQVKMDVLETREWIVIRSEFSPLRGN